MILDRLTILLGAGLLAISTLTNSQTVPPKKKSDSRPGQQPIKAPLGSVQAAVDAYVRGDWTSALTAWRLLADQGNAFAQTWVGEMYAWGDGIPKDQKESQRYYDLATNQGDPWPSRRTGRLHYVADLIPPKDFAIQNAKVEKDYAEGAACFRRSAEAGQPVAQRMLGILLGLGRGVPRDWGEGIKWWQRAADKNDADAMVLLAKVYSQGLGGVTADRNKALDFYQKAANLGSPAALKELGEAYEEGHLGVVKDYAAAESWYLKLQDKDPAAARTRLKFLYFTIGTAYMQGNGLRKDASEAAKWFRKDVDVGNSFGAAMLADMYRNGQGVPKDYTEAANWSRRYIDLLRKDAESGDGNAMKVLADEYRAGTNVSKDYSEAARLYRNVVETHFGYVDERSPMLELGRLYENGNGVPQDRVQSYMWFNLAATYGSSSAGGDRDRVERLMTNQEIKEAQTLARQWDERRRGQSIGSIDMQPPKPESANDDTISSAIDRVRTAPHALLPDAEKVSAGSGEGIMIENATQYEIHLYFQGPIKRAEQIFAGGTIAIKLPPGQYEVAAEVPHSPVLPYYGKQTYLERVAYKETFTIETRQH